jgi:hypothetical protein
MLCGTIMVKFRKYESPILVKRSRLEVDRIKSEGQPGKDTHLLNKMFNSKEYK